MVWLGYQGRRLWDWFAVLTALCVLIGAAMLTFNGERWAALLANAEGAPRPGAQLLLAFDFSKLHLWHWVTVPAAVLTIALTFWLDHLRKVQAAGGEIDPEGGQVRALIWTARGRSFLAVASMVITFVTVTRTAWEMEALPEIMAWPVTRIIIPMSNLWM